MKLSRAIFKTFFLSLAIIANVHFAYGQTGGIIPNGKNVFLDQNGKPLSSGKVFFYVPSTTTPKTTYSDINLSVPNTNPVVLDAAGRAILWGTGNYRQIVQDKLGNTIWDVITSAAGSGSGGGSIATGDGDLVGTIKPWAGMTAPNQYMFTYGQEVSRTTYAALFAAITSTQPVFCASGGPTLTGLSDTSNFWVGMTIEVSCVTGGSTTVVSKTPSSVNMAVNASSTTNTIATFFPWGRGNGATTFNLPDFRGLIPTGNNIMGGVTSSNISDAYFGSRLAESSGAQGGNSNGGSYTILTSNLPSYTPSGTVALRTTSVNSPPIAVDNGQVAVTILEGSGTPRSIYVAGSFSGTSAALTGSPQGGTSTPFGILPPQKTVNYIIKVIPDANSTTASGVTSLGGMTGDIACGTGLTCTGNIISNSFFSSAGIDTNILNPQTSNYTIASSDCGKTIQAGSGSTGFFTIAVPSVAGFPVTCVVNILNGDTIRWKQISNLSGSGCSTRNVIGPGQNCKLGIVNGAWAVLSRPGRWRPSNATTINFFTDFTNGSDTAGATDGLSSSASAFKTAEYCFLFAADQIDYNSSSQTQVLCNMAANTVDTQGMHSPIHAMVGAQGGAAFQIVGASLVISGAVSNGGLCEITVPSTATYSNNQIVSVYGIQGATGCNGTWKITGVDGTHLNLQNTTFGGVYTSGGTVTNGSSFNISGNDAVDCYFGTVMQFSNVTFSSNVNDLGLLWGCKIYLLSGNIFAGSPTGAHISIQGPSKLEIENNYGIATSAANHLLTADMGQYGAGTAVNIDMLPGVNHTFTVFAQALNVSAAIFNNITINTNSNTVTGVKCTAATLGLVVSATGTANSYFPGNSNCTSNNGGVVD